MSDSERSADGRRQEDRRRQESPSSSETPSVHSAWPVLEGRYKVGNPSSPVAICTMATVDMEFPMEKIAIAGKCVTENMGIEKIVKNTISNPHIRYMVICGKVPMGHFVDNAIISLIENGVDPEGRIIGAKGGIPVVKNLKPEEIQRFRDQVTAVSMAGETDVGKVMEKVEELFGSDPGPLESFQAEPESVGWKDADETDLEFVQDPKGYFIITVRKDSEDIAVEHRDNEGKILNLIKGKDATSIYNTIVKLGLVCRMEHAAYLGKELGKAELALRKNLEYVQDSDLII